MARWCRSSQTSSREQLIRRKIIFTIKGMRLDVASPSLFMAGEAPHTAGTRKPTHIAVIRKCASPRTSLYGRPLWVPRASTRRPTWAGTRRRPMRAGTRHRPYIRNVKTVISPLHPIRIGMVQPNPTLM